MDEGELTAFGLAQHDQLEAEAEHGRGELCELRPERRPQDPPLPARLAELPAPVLTLGIELLVLVESQGRQLALVRSEGEELHSRLQDGLRQVRAAAGAGAVSSVVEVAPWSRIPEQRALLVPRD